MAAQTVAPMSNWKDRNAVSAVIMLQHKRNETQSGEYPELVPVAFLGCESKAERNAGALRGHS